jgi:hypothetical protein
MRDGPGLVGVRCMSAGDGLGVGRRIEGVAQYFSGAVEGEGVAVAAGSEQGC